MIFSRILHWLLIIQNLLINVKLIIWAHYVTSTCHSIVCCKTNMLGWMCCLLYYCNTIIEIYHPFVNSGFKWRLRLIMVSNCFVNLTLAISKHILWWFMITSHLFMITILSVKITSWMAYFWLVRFKIGTLYAGIFCTLCKVVEKHYSIKQRIFNEIL